MLGFTSCSDYLDKEPSVSTDAPITTAAQLQALLDNTSFIDEGGYKVGLCNDDAGLSMDDYDNDYPYEDEDFGYRAKYWMFDHEYIAKESYDYMVVDEYKKIYKCNLAIQSIDEVTGSKAEKNTVLANAYFDRAWSMFLLAQYYCRPYCEANKGELGLPIRLGTVFDESIKRANLEDTYKQILSDLEKANSYVSQEKVNPNQRWRVSKAAVNGLYARIYLVMGDYKNAEKYATDALAGGTSLYDLNNVGTYSRWAYDDNDDPVAVKFPQTNKWDMAECLEYDEFVFARRSYFRGGWLIPSESLLSIFEDDDLRYQLFMVEDFSYTAYLLFSVPGYVQFGGGYYITSGLTTAELMLIQAEAKVRQGQWQEGLALLTPLREARFAAGTATPLTASNQKDALKVVLEERRREMPFSARLSDIKRYAVNETADDDVTITRSFYASTTSGADPSRVVSISVGGDDPALALPFSDYDVNATHGSVEQNPRPTNRREEKTPE